MNRHTGEFQKQHTPLLMSMEYILPVSLGFGSNNKTEISCVNFTQIHNKVYIQQSSTYITKNYHNCQSDSTTDLYSLIKYLVNHNNWWNIRYRKHAEHKTTLFIQIKNACVNTINCVTYNQINHAKERIFHRHWKCARSVVILWCLCLIRLFLRISI